jgi:TPR repeat protein
MQKFKTLILIVLLLLTSHFIQAAGNINTEEMRVLLIKANKGDVEAQIQLGDVYHNAAELELAEKYYKMAADSGNAVGQYRLGGFYSQRKQSKYPDKNLKELTLKYLKMSSDQGNLDALFYMGTYYAFNGDQVSYEKYVKEAADRGHLIAQTALGRIYRKKGDIDMAEKYYKRSIAGGNSDAKSPLGEMYLEKQKYDLAEQYLLEAAELDSPEKYNACATLGILYERKGIPELAEIYLKKGIESGWTGMQMSLARFYHRHKKLDLALQWYKDLAEKYSYLEAQMLMGSIYEEQGKFDLSRKYYQMAADNNYKGSDEALKRVSGK